MISENTEKTSNLRGRVGVHEGDEAEAARTLGVAIHDNLCFDDGARGKAVKGIFEGVVVG